MAFRKDDSTPNRQDEREPIRATPEFEWSDYFEASDSTDKLYPLFENLDPFLRPGLKALDLGCGVGKGVCRLAERGLEVTAVDILEEALQRVQRRVAGRYEVHLVKSDLRHLAFPDQMFDVIVATSILYFLSPAELSIFWPKLVSWIKPGGLFAGQFMGPNDLWVTREDYNFQTVETAKNLFHGFEILYFLDDDRDTTNTLGKSTHSHQIQVLARKL